MQQIIGHRRQHQAGRATQPLRTLEEIRADLAPAGQLRPLTEDVLVTDVGAGSVPAHWLATPDTSPEQTLLYLHGGGYRTGSLRSHGLLAAHLGRAADRRVLFPEYRLAPEHKFRPQATTSTQPGSGS